jgi:hypothetical protein
MGRGVALWFGAFTMAALVAGRENLWWIDVRPAPQEVLFLPAAVLLCWAAWPDRFRRAVRGTIACLLAVLVWNSVRHFTPPVPFTLVAALLLLAPLRGPGTRIRAMVTVAVLTIAFPLAQTLLYGRTDYTRDADVIAVFGARCYADGKPSQSPARPVHEGAGSGRPNSPSSASIGSLCSPASSTTRFGVAFGRSTSISTTCARPETTHSNCTSAGPWHR